MMTVPMSEWSSFDIIPAILVTNCLLIVLSSAAIACRVGRRVFLVRSFGWHDALITIAAVSATIFSILQMVSTRYGYGRFYLLASDEDLGKTVQLSVASRVFYFGCNWAVKHSLLLLYATLTIDYWPRVSIYIMHALAFAFGFTCITYTLCQCIPLGAWLWYEWDQEWTGSGCINMTHFNYFNSIFMLCNDMVLYAMPMVFTWKLHVSRPQRIAVNLLFALGGLVLAASGARIYFVSQQANDPDFTYRFAMTMMCAVIENHLAIIVACAPSIKVILLHAFPSLETKFEKLVSKRSGSGSEEFSIGTIAMIDLELGGNAKNRPSSLRTETGESAKSRVAKERKWWRPPSSWEVDRTGSEAAGVRN